MALMVIGMLVTVPLMSNYLKYSALAGQKGFIFNQFSLGNMGGSATHCAHIPYMERHAKFVLQCNTGMLNIDAIDKQTESELFDVGIINSS